MIVDDGLGWHCEWWQWKAAMDDALAVNEDFEMRDKQTANGDY